MQSAWITDHGFESEPERRIAGADGLVMYRCFGGSSLELGKGYFSAKAPLSVLDAELRFNIVDWENSIHFLSTFRLKPGFEYYIGPVAHGSQDMRIAAQQIFVEPPVDCKVTILRSKELIPQDVFAIPRRDDGQVDA